MFEHRTWAWGFHLLHLNYTYTLHIYSTFPIILSIATKRLSWEQPKRTIWIFSYITFLKGRSESEHLVGVDFDSPILWNHTWIRPEQSSVTLGEGGVALLPEAHGAVGEPQSSLGEEQQLGVEAKLCCYRVAHLQRQTGIHTDRLAQRKKPLKEPQSSLEEEQPLGVEAELCCYGGSWHTDISIHTNTHMDRLTHRETDRWFARRDRPVIC